MNRRRFLAASAAVVGAGLGGGVLAIQPRRHVIRPPPGDEARPEALSALRRVVVVGGGLAGLVAATELAARGFTVTLVEQSARLGGKLTGWTERALGEDWPVEHGFHGFFSQYYNLREVLAAAGIGDDLVVSPGYPVAFADRPTETFGQTTRWFPFNLLSVVRASSSVSLMDFRDDGPALTELMRFDGAATFARWDGVDFARFAAEGRINRPMVETVLEPFGKATLNRLDRLSAAEAIRFFHFYFMGNPEGLGFQFTRRDAMTAIVEPLAARLRALGGEIRVGLGARRLVRDGDRVVGVEVDGEPTSPPPPLIVSTEDVPAEAVLSLTAPDGSPVHLRRRGGEIVAFDGRCTHMGCPVAADDAGQFRCPCHGGRFDADGAPIAGPPVRPLRRLAVHTEGTTVTVSAAPSSSAEVLPCDHCVVACEVRGLQGLLGRSDWLGDPGLERGVRSLGEADPYIVWRLWLDRPVAAGRAPFTTTARFRYADSLAIYSAFQEPYVGWAARTGGSVVEVHAYAISPERQRPLPEMLAALWGEVLALLPELTGARVLHDVVQHQSNFTRWAPGDDALRPRTETALANLVLAGDHVKLDLPASLMEAAAISGRLAANTILDQEGLRRMPIPTVAPRGPLA